MRKRVLEIIKTLNITQKEFAQTIGITAGGLTDYIKGRTNDVSSAIVTNIVINYNVNPEWLLTGKGNMFITGLSSIEKNIIEIPADKESICEAVEHLDLKDTESLASYVSFLLNKSGTHIPQIKKQKSLKKIQNTNKEYLVPQWGSIAAGALSWVDSNLEGYLTIPARLLPKNINPENLFTLTAKGYSMIHAGISAGDIVVLERVSFAEIDNGEIVAIIIEGEATLKRIFFVDSETIELRPENPEYDSIFLTREDFLNYPIDISGRLIWVIKRFMDEEEEQTFNPFQ